MAKNESVAYKDYVIYPMALYLQPADKWQPMLVITRDIPDDDLTLPRSQSFTQLPDVFEQEELALGYAVEYARTLVDKKQPGLRI